VTVTTVGYGDLNPVGIGKILAGIEAFFGYLLLGLTAGMIIIILNGAIKVWNREYPGRGPGNLFSYRKK
ncbi:MAG: potassium channel family protein, partial [Candidatus Hydrothermarchaeales archaeon]